MSKRIMLFALGAVSAVMFVLPAAASAWTIEPAGVQFTGTTSASSILTAVGEPAITCEQNSHLAGSYNAGSQTKGTVTLDITGCHIILLGITLKCTSGAEGNTISSGGTFQNVNVGEATGIKITVNKTTFHCGSTTPLIVEGSMTGIVAAPGCGVSSPTSTVEFNAASGTTVETEGSGNKVAGIETTEWTLTFTGLKATKTCP